MTELSSRTQFNVLCIPGGFDVLHPDHKAYIMRNIKHVIKRGLSFDRISIGLSPDSFISRKGALSPLYEYDWRKQDLQDWFSSTMYQGLVDIDPFEPNAIVENGPNQRRLLVLSKEYEGKTVGNALESVSGRTLYLPPVNRIHSSDIRLALISSMKSSNCERQVGAVLLRDGVIANTAHNGGGPASCAFCPKRIDYYLNLERTGIHQPSAVPCIYPHAEEIAAKNAQKGDHLLTTLSPCNNCAETILQKEISRVVYVEGYHDQRPIRSLSRKGVQVRQAGYHPSIG